MKQKFIMILGIMVLAVSCGCGKNIHIKRGSENNRSPWPVYRANLQATGSINADKFNGNLDIIWEQSSNDKPIGPLTIAENYLIYPGSRRKIKFYDLSDGSYEGRIRFKGLAQTGLTVGKKTFFVGLGSPYSQFRALSLESGKTLWKKKLKDAISGSILIGDHLIAGSTEGLLVAYKIDDGESVWSYNCDGRISAPPSSDGELLFQPTDDGRIIVLSVEDGTEIGIKDFSTPLLSSVTVGDQLVFSGMDGSVFALTKNLEKLWTSNIDGPIWTSPALSDQFCYVASSNGTITALGLESGKEVWMFAVPEVIKAAPIVVGDFVVVVTMKGRLFCLDKKSGEIVSSRELEGAISIAPISDGNQIFVATNKGKIVCFGENDATRQNNSFGISTEHEP